MKSAKREASNMRIKVLLFFTLCALLITAKAQVPQHVNYQAVIRDATGDPVTNQAVSLKFTFYANAPSGTIQYSETQSVATNGFGLVNLQIGSGTPVTGTWSAIDWDSTVQYLGVAVDVTGGSNYTELSNSKLSSVPYAIQAAHSADNRWTAKGADIINNNTGAVGIGGQPDGSAALDITATGKGLLIPRMKKSELPVSPAEGLLVYQTDNTPGFYYFSSGQWHSMTGDASATQSTSASIIAKASAPRAATFTLSTPHKNESAEMTAISGEEKVPVDISGRQWYPTGEHSNSSTSGSIIAFASGTTPVTLTTDNKGASLKRAAISFGYNVPVELSGSSLSVERAPASTAFILPVKGTIKSVWGQYTLIDNGSLSESTDQVIVTGQLFQSTGPDSDQFTAIPETAFSLTHGLNEMSRDGFTATGNITNLNIPVPAGTRLMIIFSARASGAKQAATLPCRITGGISLQ